MIEVSPHLYVGNQDDYKGRVRGLGWPVVHACKEPYHRDALGYTTRGAPKDNPEYLIARRGNRLILNLIDVNDPQYIHKEMIDAALEFLHEHISSGCDTLVHCNQGESRAPTIALLYLIAYTNQVPVNNFASAEVTFRKLYPGYAPAAGMYEFARGHFEDYISYS